MTLVKPSYFVNKRNSNNKSWIIIIIIKVLLGTHRVPMAMWRCTNVEGSSPWRVMVYFRRVNFWEEFLCTEIFHGVLQYSSGKAVRSGCIFFSVLYSQRIASWYRLFSSFYHRTGVKSIGRYPVVCNQAL